jgi:signal transduction histidine kinase/DNA-binding response OmpR family regulator
MQRLLLWLARGKRDYLPPSGRSGELFTQNLRQIQAQTDQLLYYVLLIQYPAAIAVALVWSPLAWAGSESSIHIHVWLAIFFGGLLTSLPVYLIRTRPATSLTRQVIAVAQMLMGALLIHLSGGRIETHFHVFGSLAFLAFYRDVRVLGTATVVVVLDHLIRGLVLPASVYGTISATNWRFVEHAFWVIFENVFLTISCFHGRAQLAAMASQQAELQQINEKIESAVRIRTRELALRTDELALARDAAMESTRLKSQFLANVSHEIRTPMNGVLGMLGVLLDTNLTPGQRDCAATVQQSAQSLLTLLNDILDLSKIEAGRLDIQRADFLLCDEIQDAVRLFAEPAERKQLELSCEIDAGVPSVVIGDAGRFRQALTNLLSNAIKFTERGEITVRAFEAGREGNTSRVRLEVSDTGIGIAEQARKTLFQTFVQVDGSSARRHEGAGLGLAISQQLVQLMGGAINFASEPGVGSTFWFEIPVEVVSDSDTSGRIRPDVLRGLRILVVDDFSTRRDAVAKTLQSWQMLACKSADETEALDALEQAAQRGEPFDLVLLDLRPEKRAIALAKAITARGSLKAPQLLLLTSIRQRMTREFHMPAGVGACLVKPPKREELFSKIAALCGRLAAPADTIATKVAAPMETPGRKLSVLVAEDNHVNQRVLTALLSRLGHRFEVVPDGAAAIEAVRRSTYDCVLMDCQMPRIDGFEATAEIRKLPGATGQVRIVAVTANAMTGDRERCLAAGMNDYVTKPVRLAQLAEVLGCTRPEPVAAR